MPAAAYGYLQVAVVTQQMCAVLIPHTCIEVWALQGTESKQLVFVVAKTSQTGTLLFK